VCYPHRLSVAGRSSSTRTLFDQRLEHLGLDDVEAADLRCGDTSSPEVAPNGLDVKAGDGRRFTCGYRTHERIVRLGMRLRRCHHYLVAFVHVPFGPEDFVRYGLPADSEALKVELQPEDITFLAGSDWPGLCLVLVGELPPDAGDKALAPGPLRRSLSEDWTPLDIVFMEALLKDLPGVLRWSWRPREGERLDLLHIENMRSADICRLLRARSVIDVARARLGRPPGITDFKPEEFRAKLAEVVATLRKDRGRGFTQRAVASRLPTSVATLREHMKRDGVDWQAVKRGDWPEG